MAMRGSCHAVLSSWIMQLSCVDQLMSQYNISKNVYLIAYNNIDKYIYNYIKVQYYNYNHGIVTVGNFFGTEVTLELYTV